MSLKAQKEAKRQTVCVVGSGVAGLSVAWLLSKDYDVTIMEKLSDLGMDAASVNVRGSRVDTPLRLFQFNWYMNLTSLYKNVGVKFHESSARFSVSSDEGKEKGICSLFRCYNYGLWSFINMPFVEYHNKEQMSKINLIQNIAYFFLFAPFHLHTNKTKGLTFHEYMKNEGYNEEFVNYILLPALSSMLTCTYEAVKLYPAEIIIDYICGRAGMWGIQQKSRVTNGIEDVVKRLILPVYKIELNTSVISLTTNGNSVTVKSITKNEQERIETYDHLILATQANHALKIVPRDTNPNLLSTLKSVRYESGRVSVHTDTSVMPTKREQWSAFNLVTSNKQPAVMNTLWCNDIDDVLRKSLKSDVFQSWNAISPLDPLKVVVDTVFERPVINLESRENIEKLNSFQGKNNIWFVGAYAIYTVPLLESGVFSSVKVAQRLGVKIPWAPQPPVLENKSRLGCWHVDLARIITSSAILTTLVVTAGMGHAFSILELQAKDIHSSELIKLVGMQTIAWLSLRRFLSFILNHKFLIRSTKWYKFLSESKKHLAQLYMLGLLNETMLSLWSAWKLILKKTEDTSTNVIAGSNLLAYLIHDIIEMYNEWSNDPSMILHHVAGITCASAMLSFRASPAFCLVPNFLIVEISSIFLNLSWLLKEIGYGDKIVNTFKLMFFISFFLTRIVYLSSFFLYSLYSKDELHINLWKVNNKYTKGLMGILMSIQYYWFYKMIGILRVELAKI